MKKKILIAFTFICVLIVFFIMKEEKEENICFDITHRGKYPVNPYCTKCHGQDGVKLHKCSNPNGEDKYCRVCGKFIIE